jgi:hypothetical protein
MWMSGMLICYAPKFSSVAINVAKA